MSKIAYIRRKYAKLTADRKQDGLLRLLFSLSVITRKLHGDTQDVLQENYYRTMDNLYKQEKKVQQSYSMRPPKIIKPTGARR